jgi:di/tricarboxylate transporter
MTWEIAAVLGILGVSLVLFITEKLRMDVVALLVLGVLGVSQLVTMDEALAGFSNPAVVTVWAMFILSAGLSATGIADIISRQVLRLAGTGEVRMIFAIMITAGGLSAFMNNIGVAALMLPVVMDICRKTGISPSRLLMPMAYASLLGGLTTLIGTPPNLVASTALVQAGLEGFTLFEFAPVGVPALVVGAIFIAFVGRHLLPASMPKEFEETFDEASPGTQFAHSLEERRFRLRVTPGSSLAGRTLKDSGLAPVLGLSVLAVERAGTVLDEIDGEFLLQENDLMTVHGRVDEFREFLNWKAFELAHGGEILELLSKEKVGLMALEIAGDSSLVGLEVRETDFHRRFGAHILTLRRGSKLHRDGIGELKLEAGDRLMVDGRREELEVLNKAGDFSKAELISEEQVSDIYTQSDSLLELVSPPESSLVGVTIAQTGFSETLQLRVIGIVRKSGSIYFPTADETFQAGDRWLVHGRPATLDLIRAIQSLEVEDGDLEELAMAKGGDREFAEVTLSPGSSLAGKSLREVDFRRRYSLQVLSIWRHGRAYRSHLRNMKLEFGDALLLSGKHDRITALAKDSDFLVLSQAAYEDAGERRSPKKALLATAIMIAVVIPVLMGKLHISIAAVAGAAVMITCRLLSMNEAYRAIEWKSVFLIAGMIPLGTAMQTSGAAEWVAVQVATITKPFGTIGVVLGLYLITAMATMIVPTTALVLIMAPIALQMAGVDPNLSPKLVMMAIAMAASASFTSPISHPANVLVMGPGGYRFIDYVKVGVLLAAVVMVTVLPLILWRY